MAKIQENYNLRDHCSCTCDGSCEGNRFNCTCQQAIRTECNKGCRCYEKAMKRHDVRWNDRLGKWER